MGQDGTAGWHASGQNLTLGGSRDALVLSSSSQGVSTLHLGGRGILFVDARGGDGGAGGDGGRGGDGGAGGGGGPGGRGSAGHSASTPGARGGNGGPGGQGGRGGDGGSGGPGAQGGAAAPGGNGAPVTISVRDSDLPLLVLAEADVIGGASAKGGRGGGGGRGGSGGHGGSGGSGGHGGSGGPSRQDSQGHTTTQRGSSGSSGPSGHPGSSGSRGHDGPAAHDGRNAPRGNDGSVVYRILDAAGHVLAQHMDRFNAAVLSYEVVDDNADSIFEPGSTFLVRNVLLVNNGGLPLPAGCGLSFPDTPTARWIDGVDLGPHILPSIPAGGRHLVEGGVRCFRFQIPHMATASANRPFKASSTAVASVQCLDHSFLESEVSTGPLTVQWPIQLAAVQATTFLAPGEATAVVIRLNNISTRGYGTDALGRVEVRLRLHPLMRVLPCPDGSYAITPDGVAVREFFCMPSMTEVSVSVQIQMTAESGTNLFESLQWMADVYLRGKCIEYRSGLVRVTPLFQPATLSDVLLVTCPAIDRKEFLCWSYMLQLAGLSVNFWVSWKSTRRIASNTEQSKPAARACADVCLSLHSCCVSLSVLVFPSL